MPSALIEQQDRVTAGSDVLGDFGQVQVHRLAVAERQDEPDAFAIFRANRAEYVGRSGALIAGCRRARAALGPASGDLVLLADARLIGEPDFYVVLGDVVFARDLLHLGGAVFLKSS